VISMGVLRLFRGSTIVENNIVQTAASAGEALAAGVIFTLPALVLLGYWQDFPFLPVFALSLCGGVLGVLSSVPLGRALIVDAGLRIPEGVATAEVLKTGEQQSRQAESERQQTESGGKGRAARYVVIAAIAGAILKFCQTGLSVASSTATGAMKVGGAVL